MNFSRNQQETSPNINPVSGSSSFQEQGITGDFSLDLKLGQALDLGNETVDSLKVPSGSKMALSPPSGSSKRARVDFSLDLKLGQAVGMGNETLDSLKVPSGSKMVFSPPSGSSKREHAVNTGIRIASCQVDDCNVDLSCSKDYHRRHKVCELHSKSEGVIIGGHKQRFCQQCSRFHLVAEFDDGKRSCRRRLAGHNRRRYPKVVNQLNPFLVNNLLRHPSSLITDASYSSSSALPGYEVSKQDSKDDASQLLNADASYSSALPGYIVPKEDSNDDASQLLNADASYCSSLSLPGYEVPKEDSNDDASHLINAYASYSSSSSLPGYEVFLSFSVPNTCLAFANSLYTALNGVGVHIFPDIEDLHKGEEIVMGEIMEAIMESKISIPIFSKKYASSEKCLWELTEMVYCRRSMGQLILPIFYDVEPSDVKHQSGSYEEAFHKHDKLFDERAVKEWKEALWEVGELEGWDFNKELCWHGGENFIKENIVPTVLLELKKNYTNNMVVTDYLVGMDYHVNEMMRLLKVDSNEVRIVGIHGISGIGKTTIAKFIYNMLLECFECCSFLADVREVVQQNKDVVSLQKQLLADILKRCPDITDVDSGIDVIKNIVIKKKVLIILDDLDEISHFARLVGKRDWFGSGSRIIVITEDRHVLDDLKVDATYEPLVMDSEQSVQLFSMHAFRRKFPPIDYYSISKEVASTVAGIPLALEVVGSFLSSMEKEVWEDTLKKLEKISHDEVEKKLRVIYEALNYAQQQIFLDIACLFTGMDKAAAFYMWDDCGYHPKKELNVLCLMSLVNVGDANELRMHHQLRALGRKIVNEEKIRGNRSRLWNHEDALKIFEGRRGTEKVEALSLHFELGPEKKPRFTGKEFTKLVNLRYLRVDGTNLVGDFEHLLPQLRWLDWRSCSSHFKPTNFHLKNLVILDLSDSGITEDWGGWNQIKMAKKLKVLQLANCALRRTPDFSSYAALEILILRRCRSLIEVDRSIGNLKNLKVLDISYSDIRNLPDEIWMLEKLEVLDFTHCGYLKGHIPSNMGSLTSLRFLSFYDTKIQSLPTSIWELSCLQTLKLGGCTELQSQPQLPSSLRSLYVACIPNETNLVNLQELHFVGGCENVEIPRDIWKFSKLEKLTLDYTNIRTLPEEISALSQLKVLDVQFCHDLRCILGLPSSLVVISLAFCYSLERLPNLSNLKNLVKLSLRSCIKLTELQGLGNLESLIWLDIYACDMLANLDLLDQSPCYRPWRRSLYRNMKAKRREKGIR